MIDYINMKLTVNCDAEIERAVELLSRLCAEGTSAPRGRTTNHGARSTCTLWTMTQKGCTSAASPR